MVSSYLEISFVPVTSNWALNRLTDLAGSSSQIQSTVKTCREFLIFKLNDKRMLSRWHVPLSTEIRSLLSRLFGIWCVVLLIARYKTLFASASLENSEYRLIRGKWVTDLAYIFMHHLPIHPSYPREPLLPHHRPQERGFIPFAVLRVVE